jgi:16S rRNA processing protein RimM
MITENQITSIGKVNKTHGIRGELSVTMYADLDLQDLKCVVFDVDGIFVPFFINSSRPRSSESELVTLDGIDSDEQASQFVGKEMYALSDDLSEDDTDDDGYYLDDFINYTIHDVDGSVVGVIDGYDDSTSNVLFIVKTAENKTVYVPVAPEFFVDIDHDSKLIVMNLPVGLFDI